MAASEEVGWPPKPAEDMAGVSPRSRHNPPFQPYICSIYHLYPDTRDRARSVDGDIRKSASVVPCTIAVGLIQLPTPL